ncbi:MAG: hypothetical protein JRJ64_14210 [Deltaproteobacteria bacterium]|nr:hypothetical protein [Deltaproteobacteria bacterium]
MQGMVAQRLEDGGIVGAASKDSGKLVGADDLLAERVQLERWLCTRQALDARHELGGQPSVLVAKPPRRKPAELSKGDRGKRGCPDVDDGWPREIVGHLDVLEQHAVGCVC